MDPPLLQFPNIEPFGRTVLGVLEEIYPITNQVVLVRLPTHIMHKEIFVYLMWECV